MIKVSRGRCLLQHWLDRRDMSQAEFSRRTGIPRRMISFYCTNTKKMSLEAMYMASQILSVHMEDLYEWEY
ncbi:helix-turn-helix domain-containing protein [Paenibacillus nuruki]|uniref:helix-turn-helix domain-containing protein n=1 Tax=Paenibacillus nuruki TaxID=1886670 RepID=UPI0028059692|nr:helix-turn-helix transcriptional regulator [Paenibacillus nuruki]CAJ1315880.1 HTH cro/C1-type domain-containing protein [Paenibacillus nuruki]